METRAADALVEMAATSGEEQSSPPQTMIFADLEVLVDGSQSGVAELSSEALLSNQTARRLFCDCVVETVVSHGQVIVGVGRNTRRIPGWLRRLLHHRDGGQCQFPGCNSRRWLQAHHKHHWVDGGPTDLDNLILLCEVPRTRHTSPKQFASRTAHHRFLHEHGWHITGPPHQPPIFRKPDQTIYPPTKPPLHPRLKALVPTRRPT